MTDSAIDRPKERKAAMVWGQMVNAMMAGFFSVQGICQSNMLVSGLKFLLAGFFVYRACTYRPSRMDKATYEAMVLGWAVVILIVMPPLTLVMMFALDGCNRVVMWGVLLVEIIVPGFFVWRYFRPRKS